MVFKKVEVASIKTEFEEKFNYFQNQVWTKERQTDALTSAIVVVADYLQYKEFKAYFQEKGSPVGFISEHTPRSKIQGVFAKFNSGTLKYVLTTERALHYQVVVPRKFRHLIFFGFPAFLEDFETLFDQIKDAPDSIVMVVFSKKDAFEMEKLVGTTKIRDFLGSKNKFKALEI
jgi:hypothetical protein